MIRVKLIADSLNVDTNKRLTTFLLTYPRYIHAELMTHRVFSRNAASSRAIPVIKFRQDVRENPVIPTHWGANKPGMQAGEELDDVLQDWVWPANDMFPEVDVDGSPLPRIKLTQREFAKKTWLAARDLALGAHLALEKVGLHKQIANRVIEPWFHIEVLVSATEFENWFGLRCHSAAHPDIQALADAMLEVYVKNRPALLHHGSWHLPFGDQEILPNLELRDIIRICVARAARVSYKTFEGAIDYQKDFDLHDRLAKQGHWSPFEHVAVAMKHGTWSGNFCGWRQYRKDFPGENREVHDLCALWERRKKERGLETLIP